MSRANRDFGDTPDINSKVPGPGFNPGGDDFGVVRMIDGHLPYETGMDGSNVHVPSAGDPLWNDPIGVKVEDD